jgi:hypothetical protein
MEADCRAIRLSAAAQMKEQRKKGKRPKKLPPNAARQRETDLVISFESWRRLRAH